MKEKFSLLKEFWMYFWACRKWWLAPIVILLLLLGALLAMAKTSSVAPFIYAVF